jgi:hypothetical protein
MRGIFGSSLPPGVSNRMIEDACGGEGPCDVCSRPIDDCVCPECPTCGEVGRLACYDEHGLVMSDAQTAAALATSRGAGGADDPV